MFTTLKHRIFSDIVMVGRIVQSDSGRVERFMSDRFVMSFWIDKKLGDRYSTAPAIKSSRRPTLRQFILSDYLLIQGTDRVGQFFGRQHLGHMQPGVGIDFPDPSFSKKPIEVRLTRQEGASQNQSCDTIRMRLRQQEGQRRPPRPSEHQPSINTQIGTDKLEVTEKMRGRVVIQFPLRRGPPSAALIQQNDPVDRRVEETSVVSPAPGTRTPMQKEDREARRIATLLNLEEMFITP